MVSKTTIETLDRLIRASFYALIFLLPVGIGFVSTFAAFAIFFFLIKRVCIVILNRPKGWGIIKTMFLPASNFFNPFIFFYVAAAAISVVFSQNHELSLVGFFGKLMRGVLIYTSFIEAFTSVAHINNFIITWLVSAFIIGLSGLCQYFTGYDFIRHFPLVGGRVYATLRQANDFGAYLISICPLLLVLLTHFDLVGKKLFNHIKAINSRHLIWVCLLIIYLVLIICLGLTFSRAAWVAFFLSIILLGFFRKETLPYIFLIIIGFIWLFTPVMIAARDVSLITDNVKTPNVYVGTQKAPESKTIIQYVSNHLGSGRWSFWREALSIIKDYPLWGSGINTYSQMGSRYKVTWGGYPHNSYLQLTAELGILGLTTFLLMIIALIYRVVQKIRWMPIGYDRVLLIGMFASLVAYLIQSFFDTTFYSVQLSVLMWLLMAMLVAIIRMNQLTKSRT